MESNSVKKANVQLQVSVEKHD